MPTTNERQRDFWERAALAALPALILAEKDSLVEEAAQMAADTADHLLAAWRQRFAKEGGL